MEYKSCRFLWREQLQSSQFCLGFDDKNCFLKSRWSENTFAYSCYRVILDLLATGILVASVVIEPYPTYLIYATNLTFILLTAEILLSCITIIHNARKKKTEAADQTGKLPWTLKLQWILRNISYTGALTVTTLYWGFVYKPGITPLTGISICLHAVNSAIVIIDTAVSRAPIRLLHAYMPVIFYTLYCAWLVVFWAAKLRNTEGNPFVYEIIDLDRNMGLSFGIMAASVFGAVPIYHTLLFCVYAVREATYKALRKR